MKKKNVLEIIGGILVFVAVIILIFVVPVGRNKSNKGSNNNKNRKYILLNNDIKYVYIDSYEDYVKFMSDNEITKSDYYKPFVEDDFEDDKTYLFVIVPFDDCSESIKKDTLKEEDGKYNLYLDMEYGCGVCPVVRKVFTYEVDNDDLDVNVYAKEVSREECDPNIAYKPIIYIYPDKDMDLKISLGNPQNLTYTYPKYNNSWYVHVTKDGNIYDYETGRNYYSLYWEAIDNYKLDMSEGFVVKGEDTVKFLEEKLAYLGLNEYEINEFIIYWIDKLESNNYNFISFRSLEDINASMPLIISREPDTLIRVMMDYKPLDNYIEVNEQQLTKVERKGFTVVEWGGTKH